MSDNNENLNAPEQQDADRQAVAEVVEKARIALVTSVQESGALVSRPLAVQERDFDGELYFFTPILPLGGTVSPDALTKGNGVKHALTTHRLVREQRAR